MIQANCQLSNQLNILPQPPTFTSSYVTHLTDEKSDSQRPKQDEQEIEKKIFCDFDAFVSSESSNILDSKSSISKRKLFTKEEDQLLTMAAIKFNMGSWNDIAKMVPNRTPKQCRDRWTNYLQPTLNFDPWTNQEDDSLISLVKLNGTHWRKMKKYFPGRSTNALKNRWHWLINNQNKSSSLTNLNSKLQKKKKKNEKNNFAKLSDNFISNTNNIPNGNNNNNNLLNNFQIINNINISSQDNKNIMVKSKSNFKSIESGGNFTQKETGNIDDNSKNNFQDIFNENEIISINTDDLMW